MNSTIISIHLALLLFCVDLFGQENASIDSIICARIPWNIKTDIPVHFNELQRKNAFPRFSAFRVVKDSLAVRQLLKIIDTQSAKAALIGCSIHDVDARAVLKVFRNNKFETIVFDYYGRYCYRNQLFKTNIEVLTWLYQCNPLEDQTMDFFSKSVMDSLARTKD
jgi:hypothetical protein